MHKQNFVKIHSLFLKIEILTSIKGHNSVEKFRKISCATVVTILHTQNFIKIHQFVLKTLNGNKILKSIKVLTYILSVSMNLQNLIKIHQLVHKILSINKISTSIQGHNSVEKELKILFNHPNLHPVNSKAYTKLDRNPQINSQDIEHKQNSDVD